MSCESGKRPLDYPSLIEDTPSERKLRIINGCFLALPEPSLVYGGLAWGLGGLPPDFRSAVDLPRGLVDSVGYGGSSRGGSDRRAESLSLWLAAFGRLDSDKLLAEAVGLIFSTWETGKGLSRPHSPPPEYPPRAMLAACWELWALTESECC